MLDSDLAHLYEVETKYLNRQVKRNVRRFPEEFMFRLTHKEKSELVPKWHRLKKLKHSSSRPYAFTEHGITMLASVLNSDTAVRVSIYIVKAFIRLRQMASNYAAIAEKINRLESKVGRHDDEIAALIQALREMMEAPKKSRRQIGFHTGFVKKSVTRVKSKRKALEHLDKLREINRQKMTGGDALPEAAPR